MANRLFVFGIGGTGSRVIKALTMLLASGCKLGKHFNTVVPMLIDPDTSNGDLNRTKDILRLYQNIRSKINKPDDFFFHEIKTINEIAKNSDSNPEYFQFSLENTHNHSFKDYIGFNSLPEDDKNFIKLLYSDKNLEADLNIGFKGNPNMGSIVLDQFTTSDDFKKFCQVFTHGDSIFIINSIFGGTGAAGFPLLLKTLRSEHRDLDNINLINSSVIGGLTMLPYFKVGRSEDSEIDSNAFEEKSKMALRYYNRSIIDQNSVNAIYFLGLKGASKIYENHEGDIQQKNQAHLLEFIGASSIFHFTNNIEQLKVDHRTRVKEYGLETEGDRIKFRNIDSVIKNSTFKQLAKFRFFCEYLEKGLHKAISYSRWTNNSNYSKKKTLLDSHFFNSSEYTNYINKFADYFNEWVNEMDQNRPEFSPFKKIRYIEESMDFITELKPVKKDGFKKLDYHNNLNIDEVESTNAYTQLIKLFGKSTEEVLNKNILNN